MTDKKPRYQPLSEIQTGARIVVRRVDGGRGLLSRLAALGLVVGSDLEVLQNSQDGPMLVRVRNTRVALGRDEARKVLVGELPG
jgi:ferrous iron transport protein A